MNKEKARLESFDNWRYDLIVNRDELARYGFYHIHPYIADLVECFDCGVRVGLWEKGDDVGKEHLKWSPHCKFINGHQSDNIAIDEKLLKYPESQQFSITPDEYGVDVPPDPARQHKKRGSSIEDNGLYKMKIITYAEYSHELVKREFSLRFPSNLKDEHDVS